MLPASTIIWNALEYKKSPTSTLAGLCGGMDEFHNSGQIEPLNGRATQCAAHQQQQGRTQTFAPGRQDVSRDLRDQGHPRVQALGNHRVNLPHVFRDERKRGRGAG